MFEAFWITGAINIPRQGTMSVVYNRVVHQKRKTLVGVLVEKIQVSAIKYYELKNGREIKSSRKRIFLTSSNYQVANA